MKFLVKETLSKRHSIVNLIFNGVIFLIALAVFLIVLKSIPHDDSNSGWLQQPIHFKLIPLLPLLFAVKVVYDQWNSFYGPSPSTDQVQVVSHWRSIVGKSILFVALFLPAFLLNLWFPAFAVKKGISLMNGQFIFSLLSTNLMLIWWLFPLKSLIRYFKQYWQHVKITGRFDQPVYHPGEMVNLKVDSRLALVDEGHYLVRFQYVVESWIKAKRYSRPHREFPYRKATNMIPSELAEKGTRFTLPSEAFFEDWANRLDDTKNPAYWEILLEENDLVIARFLVPVVVSG